MKKIVLFMTFAIASMSSFAGFVDKRNQPSVQAAPAAPVAGSGAVAAPDQAKDAAMRAPEPVVQQAWEIRTTDGSLSRALLRWSRESGIPISYEAPSDLSAVAASYGGDFWAALQSLLADTANGDYPLHGCQYDNVTRILSISQSCNR